MTSKKMRGASRPLLKVSDATITTPTGRVLFDALRLSMSLEHVALVGRNGVGKSTLLEVLSGRVEHEHIRLSGKVAFVPQLLRVRADDGFVGSHGELRRRRLEEARAADADFLFLDEPTDDLDDEGVASLRAWLRDFRGGLIVASHDLRLLQDFRHFFVASESGCSSFSGPLSDFLAEEERRAAEEDERYLRTLRRLAEKEEHTDWIARRKLRKKQFGRCRELRRATPRGRLNQKRDYAQVSHGKLAQIRESRILAVREWSKSARRALSVRLALDLPKPRIAPDDRRPLVVLENVSAIEQERTLFQSLDLHVGRERIAVTGPNGAGKTTLLRILLGQRAPDTGRARSDLSRVGSIAQGATNWMLDTTLLAELCAEDPSQSADAIAQSLVAHKFPIALADRPLRSLSPGERVRAALICLYHRMPCVELLVLDEPTFGLDLLGQRALANALRIWPGGLVVASHDISFLQEIGLERSLHLPFNV